MDIEELKTRAKKTLDKYRFLFETNLSSFQIRTILIRELMEVISIGFLCFDMRKERTDKKQVLVTTANRVSAAIKAKYPNLPLRKTAKEFIYFWQECFDWVHDIVFENLSIKNLWYLEFFKKTKWYFEQLNSCEPEYIDKYREQIYREIRFAINIWSNRGFIRSQVIRHFRGHISGIVKIAAVETNTNTHLQELVEEILSYFSESELISLEKIDSKGEKWSFKEQLLDRYYSKYPSFASLEEIKSQIKKTVEQYKPLLWIENQKETVRELFLDELEKGVFISKDTHIWNKEMLKNLDMSETELNSNYLVFQSILDLIGPEHEKNFYLETQGKKYDLKTLLIARWKNAGWDYFLKKECKGKSSFTTFFKRGAEYDWQFLFSQDLIEYKFNCKRKEFKEKTFPIVYLETIKNKEMSSIDMQIFLEKLDFFFLTPWKPKLSPVDKFSISIVIILLPLILLFWIARIFS